MALIGRFAITAAYSSAYLYSTEIFPTSLRSIGLSFCTLVGRIGAVLAPYIASVVGDTYIYYMTVDDNTYYPTAIKILYILIPEITPSSM